MGECVPCRVAPRYQLGEGLSLELWIRQRTASFRISGLEEVEQDVFTVRIYFRAFSFLNGSNSDASEFLSRMEAVDEKGSK